MNATERKVEVTPDPVTKPQHGFCGECYPFESTIVMPGDVLIALCGAEVPWDEVSPATSGEEHAKQIPPNACTDCVVVDTCPRGH